MQKSFNKFGLAGIAAAIALTPAIASAQETAAPGTPPTTATGTDMQTMPPTGQTTSPTSQTTPPTGQTTPPPPMAQTMPERRMDMPDADKKAVIDAWPDDRKGAFKQWPTETQAYFWSLTPQRQNIFWALSDSDKVTLSNMPKQQREATWAQIESQLTTPQS